MDLRHAGRRAAIWIVMVATLALIAGWVWPTRWRYEPSTPLIRIDRFTGRAQSLCSDGWRTLERDPFVDLGENVQLAPMCYWLVPSRRDMKTTTSTGR
jgi:hypothetical protein